MKNINKYLTASFLVSGILVLNTSCEKDKPEPLVATSIELVSGGDQTAIFRTALSAPIEVIVKDQNDDLFAGATVNFIVSEGSISSAVEKTDATGNASVTWTLGSSLGSQSLSIIAFKDDGITPLTGSPINVNARSDPIYSIGEFNHGGIIFYIDSTGEHGLVCAKSDLNSGVALPWWNGEYKVITDLDTVIGAGNYNTYRIFGQQGIGISYAAEACIALSTDGYSDWFLPSRDALILMYQHSIAISSTAISNGGGPFTEGYYWSSSANGSLNYAHYVWIGLVGGAAIGDKSSPCYVRAVRAF